MSLPEISDAHYVFLNPDASLVPRTRPLKCMEQSAFLFNLNQGKDRNDKNVEKYSEAHHKLCFIDETKNFMVYLWVPMALKQHVHRHL